MNVILKDKDVRSTLLAEIDDEYKNVPDTIVINELGLLQGLCRVDVAVLNGIIHGYEIKSDADTLERLPSQVVLYSRVLDKITLVVGEKHLENALDIIPKWWGVKIFSKNKNITVLNNYREEKENCNVDVNSVVELLWRQEVIELLIAKNIDSKILKRPKDELYKLLVEQYSLQEIKNITRTILKNRTGWRGH